MRKITFDTPVIKIPGLETKFDTSVISNSFVALIGDYIEARIIQQLHYWSYSEYGVIIKGLRWIYKPIREWLSESFVGFTSWQLRKAIASLVQKGILLKEHLFKEHHGNNFAPKNRTYYYSVNYKKLEELVKEKENVGSTENIRFVNPTEQFCESSENQFCDKAKNITKNTSIENSSRDLSHPHLPCVCKEKERGNNQEKQELSNSELPKFQEVDSVNPKVIKQDINIGLVEENINQYICTNKQNVQESVQIEVEKPRLKTPKGTKSNCKRRNDAPWKDEGQFKQFYRALIQALPIVANARSAPGLAQVIIKQLRSGIPHTYWDDFAAGLPIGTSTKPEWEVEPGVPYPMFIEYLTEKIIRGNNTQTQSSARNEVFRILNQPRQAKAFWGQFKRSVVNVSEQVERDRALGVSNPNTPVWTRERIEPSVEEAAMAGKTIMAVNSGDLAAIESVKTPQLENKDSAVVSTPPNCLDAHTCKSSDKSIEISPPSDPWNNDEVDVSQSPKPSLREMLEARGVKGFCKPMPKVSQAEIEEDERRLMKPKTNIETMMIAEINDYLKDPVLRAQLTPQLFHSNYELITDYLGQIIGVKLSELQIREKRSQSMGE